MRKLPLMIRSVTFLLVGFLFAAAVIVSAHGHAANSEKADSCAVCQVAPHGLQTLTHSPIPQIFAKYFCSESFHFLSVPLSTAVSFSGNIRGPPLV